MIQIFGFFFSFLICFQISADQKIFVVGVGADKPPYLTDQGQQGLEVEIISAVLKRMNFTPKFSHFPQGRLGSMVDEGVIDGAITLHSKLNLKSCLSDPYITYQNVVVTPERIKIKSLKDLAGLRVGSFQIAKKVLGTEYAAVTEQMKSYDESVDQSRVISLVLSGRLDAYVGDERIFRTVLNMKGESAALVKYKFHKVFKPVQYMFGMKDPSLCHRFNDALKALKSDKSYEKILKKYN